MDFLPGGYNFIHVVFWGVMALVSVGMFIVPIILATGMFWLFLESVGKD